MSAQTHPSLVETVSRRIIGLARDHLDERLPTERNLSAQFGVSRSVIREAAKRLENQGLLEIRQGSGMKVVAQFHKPINSALHLLVPDERARLRQLIEVRSALEPHNAALAAERASEVELRSLSTAHDAFSMAITLETRVQADMHFHCLLAEISGNRIAAVIIQSLSELLQTSLTRGYSRVTNDLAVVDHGTILNAILQRHPASAAEAMRQHLTNARNDLGL